MPGPLAGLVVIDCSRGVAGGRATGMLADYGAEVIWVEPPGGDPCRQELPAACSVFNRGKRSVVLDLADSVQRDQLLSLVDKADVFIHSWQPGVAERLGVTFEQLRSRSHGLIYCSISGFGPDGPLRDVPGHEALVHALVGTMETQVGHREGPIFQGLPFAGIGASYLALIGILGALLRREEDGVGRHVETSMFDGALAYHSMGWGESDESIAHPPLAMTMAGISTTRLIARSFQCADDEFIGVHTGAVGAFGRLMKAVGFDDRIQASETASEMGTPLTPEERDLIQNELHLAFLSKPRRYWVNKLLEVDVCAVEHLRPGQVFDEEQAVHNEMVATLDDPVLGRVLQVAPPAKLSATPAEVRGPAPMPGQHTQEVLAGLNTKSWWAHSEPGTPDVRPLFDGIKILDLGAFYAGPYSSRLLADFGADVIKIEPIQGDPLRGLERPFYSCQAGKRSVAANLKDPALRRALQHLLQWADVVHHNLRPGAAERLGLDYETVQAVNPKIVYLYAPGWGSTGPHKSRQSFAPMMSGYVGVTYEVAGQFNEPMPPAGNEDPGNGLLGAVGILLGLLVRRRTGYGQYVENPQLNATMEHMAHVVRTTDGTVLGSGRLDTLQFGNSAVERLYEGSDGWLCVVALQDHEVAALGTVLGLRLVEDERFATREARQEHDVALGELLAEAIASRSIRELVAELRDAGVPAAEPVVDAIHSFLNDSEQRRVGRVAEVRHAIKGNVREIATLVRVTDAEVPPHGLAPELGEHTDRVLGSVGYEPEEIAELRARGAIR